MTSVRHVSFQRGLKRASIEKIRLHGRLPAAGSDGEFTSSYKTTFTETASRGNLSLDDAPLSPASVDDHELPHLAELTFNQAHPHLDLLPVPSDQYELIHHWINFLSLSMAPGVKCDTSYHTKLTPMALSGLNSDSQKSSEDIAVFHEICAASALNLSNVKGNDDRFWRLGIRHRRLALYHLRKYARRWPCKSEKSGFIRIRNLWKPY